jgi:hypothetical protein
MSSIHHRQKDSIAKRHWAYHGLHPHHLDRHQLRLEECLQHECPRGSDIHKQKLPPAREGNLPAT